MKILAERLRLLRTEKKLSQVEFAKIIGLSTNGYQRYELDERDPVAPVIVEIAKYYNVSADYLLGLTDTPR